MLELLHLGGRPIQHAVLMMIPEAWENHAHMDPARKAFYRFHASLMEPWDGPANVSFTDGTVIGAVLDRNGLRPGRYWVTADGLVVLGSEAGVLDIPADQIVRKGRLQPGKMFLVDTAQGRIIEDDEVKAGLAAEQPYQEWLDAGIIELDDLPERPHVRYPHGDVVRRQLTFGYTIEDQKILIAPMARTGGEALGSMGTDTPIAVLSERPRLLFDYFAQLFAQVTNPPLDAIREEMVTSLGGTIGPEQNLLAPGPRSCRQIQLPFPILDNDQLAKLIHVDDSVDDFREAVVIPGLYPVAGGGAGPAPRPSRTSAARSPRPSPTAPTWWSSRTGTPRGTWPPSRRCCSPPPCTTTWCARRPGPTWAWWSRPATPARCTTWRCSSGTAPPPSTPTWPSRPSRT